MTQNALTHADLAAKLAVDGLLPMIEGKPRRDQIPIPSLPLKPEDKARLALPPGALAVFYPLGETGVFMTLNGADARVWYAGVNTDGALETFERKLRDGYPNATFTEQADHPDVNGMSVRLYNIDFSPEIFAVIEATYPTTPDIPQQFIVRIHAQQRLNARRN